MRLLVVCGLIGTVAGCGPNEADARAYLKEQGLTVLELKKENGGFDFKGTKDNEICTGTVSVEKGMGSSNSSYSVTCERDTRACKPGAADACVKIADELYGKEKKVFPTLAAKLYRTACDDRNAHACNRVSEFETIGKNWFSVREYGTKGCELGSADACYRIGVTEMNGDGTPKNEAKSLEMFKKACDLGSNSGCRGAVAAMLNAEPRNFEGALPIAEKLCTAKDAEGCNLLGFGLFHEKKNLPRAAEILEGACKSNAPQKAAANSCNLAGVLYVELLGRQKDPTRALKLFEAACEKDHPDGCFNVGLLNQKGLGTTRNAERAKEFTAKACTLGMQKACPK